MRSFELGKAARLGAALLTLGACGSTVDALGDTKQQTQTLKPLVGPASYPNAFKDLLGKSDADISAKIAAAFAQLFHGDPATQAIYYGVGSDQAYILDVLHGDRRTEGLGWAMLIAVELDKRDEFDKLWRYAKSIQYSSGAMQGYFPSVCDISTTTKAPCVDPFGLEQFVMALLFAHDRWRTQAATIDYQADALALFHLMRHKEDDNGGIVDGVTNTFDVATQLVFDVPNVSANNFTRPSVEMPAYYALWSQATGDPFWLDAAASARSFVKLAANSTTGLTPVRAYFAGAPVPGSDSFQPECYRVQLNLTLDAIWNASDAFDRDESNRLLAFFTSQGIDSYGTAYSLDGTSVLTPAREPALIMENGVSALVSSNGDRTAYVQAVWDLDIPSGNVRYYAGLTELLALLVLGGQFRVY